MGTGGHCFMKFLATLVTVHFTPFTEGPHTATQFFSGFIPLEGFKMETEVDKGSRSPERSVVALQLCQKFQSLETFDQKINRACSTCTCIG